MSAEQITTAQPTSVYRYYDRRGILLYVGITARGVSRNREHNGTKVWWQFVARQEVDHFAGRPEALRRERDLIQRHRPPFNKQHNPDHIRVCAAYMALVESERERKPALGLSDPLARLSLLNSRIPLVATEIPGADGPLPCFATPPEYFDIARYILVTEGVAVTDGRTGKRFGAVQGMSLADSRVLFHIHARQPIPPIVSAHINVAVHSQRKPVVLRLASLVVEPRSPIDPAAFKSPKKNRRGMKARQRRRSPGSQRLVEISDALVGIILDSEGVPAVQEGYTLERTPPGEVGRGLHPVDPPGGVAPVAGGA